MSKPPTGVMVRWTLAALACAGGLYEWARVFTLGLDWGVLDKTLIGLGAMFVAVLLIGPELVGWVVAPVQHMVDRLLLPSESEPPPADFKLARFYAGHLRHTEACEEYAKIIRYHPGQSDAYLEGIREAFLAGDEPLARKFYGKARRIMREPGERKLLGGVYAARHEADEPETLAAEEAGGITGQAATE